MLAAGRPPALSPAAVCRVVYNFFNFKNVLVDSVKSLPGYEDRNYYFRGETLNGEGSEFILKLGNPNYASLDVVNGLNKLLLYIKSCGFSFSSSYPLPCKSGEYVFQMTAHELTIGDVSGKSGHPDAKEVNSAVKDSVTRSGSTNDIEEMMYHVRVFTFLTGQEFDKIEKKYLTAPLLFEVGVMLGKIDKELKVILYTDCGKQYPGCYNPTVCTHQRVFNYFNQPK